MHWLAQANWWLRYAIVAVKRLYLRAHFLVAWPHEQLHLLALRWVGQKPEAVGPDWVKVPESLPYLAYVFVVGLPGAIAWTAFVLILLHPRFGHSLIWGIGYAVSLGYAVGSNGDLALILMRTLREFRKWLAKAGRATWPRSQ